MNKNDTIKTSDAPKPVGAYPHAKRHGKLLFLSGIGPRPIDRGPVPGVVLDDTGEVNRLPTPVAIELMCIAKTRES